MGKNCSPGEGIVSTYQGGYAIGDGTSASAPYVSGTAALIYAANPSFTANDVIYRLLSQSDPIAGTGSESRRAMADSSPAMQ